MACQRDFFFLERERYRKGEEGSFHGGRDRDSELGGKKVFLLIWEEEKIQEAE